MKISVVVPVYNRVHLTQRCLDSLFEGAQIGPHELVIVDNASSDETPTVLKAYKTKWVNWAISILRNDTNRGVSACFNQGVKSAQGDLIAVLNNDTWVMEGWDRILVEQIQKLNADMIGPTADEDTFDPVMTPRRIRKFVKRNSGKYKKKWSSLMMFFRRSVFEKIGYFDERFFATYEDTDLQKRMDDYGLTYFMISDFRIWHASQGTRKIEKMP